MHFDGLELNAIQELTENSRQLTNPDRTLNSADLDLKEYLESAPVSNSTGYRPDSHINPLSYRSSESGINERFEFNPESLLHIQPPTTSHRA